ncbi:hypothetical protein SAMN04488515_3298 [Cognatiyoonia koreensis]|uniref:DUF1643 domain-containing protein n=1 Tax=Cognatiyoonia koreensis TaxID=364200 RepID=A0A1I0RUX9_9RHOB|nr:DUF1643 domain-containing protein [Cognatiyoonia koreensis]SEW45182.1 hypothetical protein SAMN04488515_3298 [Cognatiyoonia koreensis]
MIVREHRADGTHSVVSYSDCQKYRYALTRTWDSAGQRLLIVMLNPSKADEIANDPTVERCERRARTLGFGSFRVLNIFAWRDTDPFQMRNRRWPVGPENDAVLSEGANWADMILAAWGVHGAHRGRGPCVARTLAAAGKPLTHLGLTKDGHPRHPLYVSYKTQPEVWDI